MAKVEVLSIKSFLSWFTLSGLYVITYGWLLGMSVWVTFFGGVLAYKVLPRQQFRALQQKTFPIYFILSTVLSSLMTAHWVFTHPDVVTYILRPGVTDVAQLYALLVVLGSQSLNYFVIGPITSKTMLDRQKLEKEEGKNHDEQNVSDKIKVLNRKFGMFHGISSFLNLTAVVALAFHGLYMGNAGVKGY